MSRLLWLFVAFLLLGAPAQAEVRITFYSHNLSLHGVYMNFPHGYVALSGTTPDGKPVKANFGFTPPAVSPAILFGRVDGEIAVAEDSYVAEGIPHLSFVLNDVQYRAVLALVEKWRSFPQPSYDLDERNCVSFVKAVAVAVGLSVSDDGRFNRKPAEFLDDVAGRNATYLAGLERKRTAATAQRAVPAGAMN